MEISLKVAKAPPVGEIAPAEDILMTCAFTMVSLDPITRKPVAIAPLQLNTDEERRLFAIGEKNSNEKKALAKKALRKQAPDGAESDMIHSMWLKQLDYHDPNVTTRKPENLVYMDHTRLYSSQIMQPQYRNRHNFMIFGGYLLKQTFELAFCCAASFSHSRPTFISLDPSSFANPVPVGSVLYLSATVAYTDSPLVKTDSSVEATTEIRDDMTNRCTRVQIRVDSKVRNIEHGETKPAGQFNYTFLVEKDIKIMPRTYSEYMIWTDARRRAEKVKESGDGLLGSSNEELLRILCGPAEGGSGAKVTE